MLCASTSQGAEALRIRVASPLQFGTQQPADEPNEILTSDQTGLYPQLMLFGDSITQQSTMTVQPRMQTLYVRRADVLNRGFSGYTTKLALQTLSHFLPLSTPSPSSTQPVICLVVVFFGANDACLPGNAQHIPLPQYVDNLRRIAEYPVFKRHDTKIILMTPGPINEWQLGKPVTRTAANARRYASAVRKLAQELQIPCVDLWTAFMKRAEYTPPSQDFQDEILGETSECFTNDQASLSISSVPTYNAQSSTLPGSIDAPENDILPTLLLDGLHFTDQGYDILFDELMAVIRAEVPECAPENMPMQMQGWKVILGVPEETPPAERLEDDCKTMAEIQAAVDSTPPAGDRFEVNAKDEIGVESSDTPESWTDVEADADTRIEPQI